MTSELVMVPVPSERLQEIYALLAQTPFTQEVSNGNDSTTQTVTPPNEGSNPTPTTWDDESIKSLYIQSNNVQRKVLEYLANHPERMVTTRDMAKALKLSKGPRSLAGIVGGMARRAHNRHKEADLPWISHSRYINENDPTQGTETVFVMPQHAARVVLDTKKAAA